VRDIDADQAVRDAAAHAKGAFARDESDDAPQPVRGALGWVHGAIVHNALRGFMLAYLAATSILRGIARLIPRRRIGPDGVTVLLTGTFHSANWIEAHLRPLAAAQRCGRVYVVSTYPIPTIERVTSIYPPRWLRRIVGDVPARLISFAGASFMTRPHIVGGFHLLLNGLAAGFLAPLVRARTLYLSVGGPWEVLDGGIRAENRLFGKLTHPDRLIERMLVSSIQKFDLIATMGSRAVEFFRARGITRPCRVMAGGMDTSHLAPASEPATIDVVFVGRLAAIKRVDVFLAAIRRVRESVPGVSAVIVGDGELRSDLERTAIELGVDSCVRFVGQQSDVASWLRRARIFVLSSDSEGLALSLIEAMLCGVPPVVSNVGDLGDLVVDGVNGFLVPRRDPDAFAERIASLLLNEGQRLEIGHAARDAALHFDVRAAGQRWDDWFAEIFDGSNPQHAAATAEGERR
jgi:glycosyltransferase involved in cell wall biosynthesis